MIGVCIKYFHENYGGMLQAYATTKMLEARNIDYELIQYEKKRTNIEKIKSIPRLLNGVLLNDKYENLIKKRGMKKHPEFAANDKVRMKAFEKFKKSNFVKLSPIFVGYKDLCQGANRYKAIITGSDQLWSPAGLPTNFYNLMFVPDGIRKISYASSFGVSSIPWYQRNRTRKYLERIDYISTRENRGSEIVEELIGKHVPTILDPVFTMDKDEWLSCIPNKREIQKDYVFAYFLGDNVGHREAVEKFAKNKGLKIVTLRHLDRYVESDEMFGDYAPYDVAPDDFLNLLRNAEYVFTDSFHGMCFSIINEKEFVVFNRYDNASKNSKNSRIDSLCGNLHLEKRRFTGDVELIVSNRIDYTKVKENLEILKKDAEKYISEALQGVC